MKLSHKMSCQDFVMSQQTNTHNCPELLPMSGSSDHQFDLAGFVQTALQRVGCEYNAGTTVSNATYLEFCTALTGRNLQASWFYSTIVYY